MLCRRQSEQPDEGRSTLALYSPFFRSVCFLFNFYRESILPSDHSAARGIVFLPLADEGDVASMRTCAVSNSMNQRHKKGMGWATENKRTSTCQYDMSM